MSLEKLEEVVTKEFEKIDTSLDGYVTIEELYAYLDQMVLPPDSAWNIGCYWVGAGRQKV